MTCRCTKISKCKDDILYILNAKSTLQTLKNNNGTLDTGLSELGRRMQDMATPDNMSACVTAINNLNKDSASAIDAMISHCVGKIYILQIDRARYEREDKEYHSSCQAVT